jgi:hypothetical protein
MLIRILVVAGVLMLAVQACSTEHNNDTAKTAQTLPSEPTHVWKDQVNTLKKAQQVEQTMDQAYRQRDAAMEQQSQ